MNKYHHSSDNDEIGTYTYSSREDEVSKYFAMFYTEKVTSNIGYWYRLLWFGDAKSKTTMLIIYLNNANLSESICVINMLFSSAI